MNNLPLTPFLQSLSSDGIEVKISDHHRIDLALRRNDTWTVKQLRGVLCALLVHEPEQEELFIRRFNTFFNTKLKAEIWLADIGLDLALRDFEQLRVVPLLHQRVKQAFVERRSPYTPSITGKNQNDLRFSMLKASRNVLLAAMGIVLLVGFVIYWGRGIPTQSATGTINTSAAGTPSPINTNANTVKPLTLTPTPLNVEAEQNGSVETWKFIVLILLSLILIILLYLLYKWMSRNVSLSSVPRWNSNAPRYFRFSSIGGPPAPRIESPLLDQFADSLGYFQSESSNKILDAKATCRAFAENMGHSTLIFKKKKYLYQVYVIEDAHSETLIWNSIARELVNGLEARGIIVKHGRFFGAPEKIEFENQCVNFREELNEQTEGSIFLVFSDSKSINYFRDQCTLEALSRCPMAAWMELREPDFWDQSTALISEFKIPIFPATGLGLLSVLKHFLSAHGDLLLPRKESRDWNGAPPFDYDNVEDSLKTFLGEALHLAQACSMIQPITIGLADSLRLQFAPHLPPERTEKLFQIPGTTRSIAGFKFSATVLAALRRGFAVSWSESKQEEILKYILKIIKQVEPKEAKSLAHICWEYVYQRVNLELRPDEALKRIVQLGWTPLDKQIRADFRTIVVRGVGQSNSLSNGIPLRVNPRTKSGWIRLGRLAKHIKVPQANSVHGRHHRHPYVRIGRESESIYVLPPSAWPQKS